MKGVHGTSRSFVCDQQIAIDVRSDGREDDLNAHSATMQSVVPVTAMEVDLGRGDNAGVPAHLLADLAGASRLPPGTLR
ncbi:hypothetical protein CSZ94_04480 [Janthinobacterium sp. ROICE36]|uniref:hypothetical protein n=1 Tax=Janthinobacterium sp. ROICE36 TaxID=2048670 RepID=UPI000C7F1A15|nr:hypothetical protein [Janthinobacterium sp. ROICE36]PLY45320.1 hypothetical protein CSZ94_04480 [Janthinobacterium sp. ROICE36]